MVKITRNMIRPVVISAFFVSFVLAIFTAYDSFVGDRRCPEFSPADYGICLIAKERLSSHLYGSSNHSSFEYWEGLRPTLRILDEINPEVSGWVRQKHKNGDLQFIPGGFELAKFDFFTRKLSICHTFFIECEKEKAALLCHEYRHSRQNFAKVARYILSFAFHKEGNIDIIENDAYLYEEQARSALSNGVF